MLPIWLCATVLSLWANTPAKLSYLWACCRTPTIIPLTLPTKYPQRWAVWRSTKCANVSVAAQAVAEGSNEVGTIYYSDYYDFQDALTILAQDDGTLTGPIVYPVCQIANPEADEEELAATEDFLVFLQTPAVQEIFQNHCFIVNA